MKKIEAIIRKSKFRSIKNELKNQGFTNFYYHLVRSSSESEFRYYRGVEYDVQSEERIKVSIYVDSKMVQKILEIIKNSGLTGDVQESYIGIYKPEKMYQLVDENGKDNIIEII